MRYFCKSCGNAFEAEPAGQTVYCSKCGAPQPAHSSATRKKPIIWLALIAVPVILFLIGGTVIVFKLLPTLLTGTAGRKRLSALSSYIKRHSMSITAKKPAYRNGQNLRKYPASSGMRKRWTNWLRATTGLSKATARSFKISTTF